MKLKSTARKSIATIPTGYQGQERRFAQSVSESLDTLTGRRGPVIDRAVTFRDLLDTGVLKLASGIASGGGSINVVSPTASPDGGPTELPTKPTITSVSGGFGVIFLQWTLPPYRGHDYVEIFRLQQDDFDAAKEAGAYTRYYGDVYTFADTNVGSNETWYYWVRAVNIDGVKGPFNDTAGNSATTALDYEYVSGLIDEILDSDRTDLGLNNTIDDISGVIGDYGAYTGDDLITFVGDIVGVIGDQYSNYTGSDFLTFMGSLTGADASSQTGAQIANSLVSEVFPDGTNQTGLATSIKNQLVDENGDYVVTANAFSAITTEVYGAGAGASSSRIDALYTALTLPNTDTLMTAQAFSQLQTEVLGDPPSASASRIDALYTALQGSDGSLITASAVSNLETEVYGTGGAGSSRIDALYTALQDSDGSLITATAVSNLETEVYGAGGAGASRIDALYSALEGSDGSLITATAVSNLETEVYGTGGAGASRIDALQTSLTNSDGDIVAAATALDSLNTVVFPNGSANASSITGLQLDLYNTDADGNPNLGSSKIEQALEIIGDASSGIQSKYSVKVDTNGHVSGFGLISNANNGAVTSSFIVSADRFAIAAPFNATSAQDTAVGTNYPFKVFTTDTVVNEETIPAGVYIDDAFIRNAQITTAMIKDSTITTAKILNLSATKITSGNIQIDASNDIKIYQGKTSFNSNNSGFWLGLNNDAGSFHVGSSASKYLKFDGNSGDLVTSGLEVRAADGTILLDAGGTGAFSGSNLVPNGDLYGGVGQTSNNVWGDDSGGFEIIPFWEVADANNGRSTQPNVSYWTPSFGGVIQLFYGSTFRMAEHLPAYSGQVYYLAVDNNMNNNELQWQAQIQFADSNKQYINGTQINASPTSSLWDEPPVSSSQGAAGTPTSGARFSVAKIEVPSNTNIRYMRIRFYGGSNTGNTAHYVNITSVYLGQVPPVIGPKYASTFIRDLAVDTLQIAGNAVTVPLGAANENISSNYYLAVSGTQTTEGEIWSKVCDLSAMSWASSNTAPEAITLIGSMNYAAATSGSSYETVNLKLIMRSGSTVPATVKIGGVSPTSNVTVLQGCGVSKQRNHSGTLSVNFTLTVSDYNLQPNTNYYFALVGQTNAGFRRMFNNGLSAVASKK